MKVIKPSFEIITPIDSEQILKTIEAVEEPAIRAKTRLRIHPVNLLLEGLSKEDMRPLSSITTSLSV